MNKISIIIPVYNVYDYLDRCMETIINQTYKNIEIILINDGSTDNSLELCNKYKKLDKRVVVLDKCNGGVSSARNSGLDIATGDYIGFIDPDDWIELDMYESMYNEIINNECDVVMCSYIREYKHNSTNIDLKLDEGIYTRDKIVDYIIANMISSSSINGLSTEIMGSVWKLLIKRELIDKGNILFDESIHLAEDLIFSINLFLNANKVYIQKKYSYHYFDRDGSAVNKHRENLLEENRLLNDEILKILKKSNLDKKLIDRIYIREYRLYYWTIEHYTRKNTPMKFIGVIDIIKSFCNDNNIEYIVGAQRLSESNWKKNVYIYFVKKKIYIMIYLYHKIQHFWRVCKKFC